MKPNHFGFIGLGLIGGSIAKAIRHTYPEAVVYASDPNENSIALALSDGTINQGYSEPGVYFLDCEFLFLCAPVTDNVSLLSGLSRWLSPEAVLTDVGSVKGTIHREIQAYQLSSQFIGGHPMAGSERYGFANAKSRLLENAYYILTPSPGVAEEKVVRYRELVRSIGAIPLILDERIHDYATAAVSHLPHIIASSLVNLVRDSDSEEGIMKLIAAGGFKDITRIASSSPDMWQQICLTNTENISSLLERYISALTETKHMLDEKNQQKLYSFFEEARVYRDSFLETSSGPIKKVYAITVDIADETGALATIATILALQQISIKNIGIVHNRELEEGVLRIEFYEEEAVRSAGKTLQSRGYQIHEKK